MNFLNKNKYDYDLIVIGAGSGGLTAAIGAAYIGASVLLIEKHKVGGDCTHYGCVPSKALLSYSRKNKKSTLKDALTYTQNKIEEVYTHETPELLNKKYGIKTIIGGAKFVDNNTVKVLDEIYTAKKIVISTGSRAFVPPIEGISKIEYLTNESIFNIQEFKSITIIGAGPIGTELATAFLNIGIEVNLVNTTDQILNREDPDAIKIVQDDLLSQGINLYLNSRAIEFDKSSEGKCITTLEVKGSNKKIKLTSDKVLISTGRKPNVSSLDLEKASVDYNKKGIKVNSKLQTSNKNIFAIGDVIGGMQFTHLANSHGKTVLANTIFANRFNKVSDTLVPRVTFTNIPISSIGKLEKQLKSENIEYISLYTNYNEIDNTIASEDTGFIKILVNKKGSILGSTIVGKNSEDLIALISNEMSKGKKNDVLNLTKYIYAYPTLSYGLGVTANKYKYSTYTENKKNFTKKIFGLRG